MQRVQRTTLLTAAILAGGMFAGAAHAQVIRITNVNSPTGHDIPLEADSSVQIDSTGNLLAKCALTNNVCTALSTSNTSKPTATLSRIDTDTSLTAGETVRLAWTSTNAEACKVSTTGPTSTSFNGVRATALSTGELATVAQGAYTFSLVCYNAGGASTVSSISATVAAATTPPPGGNEDCNITSTDPTFNPSNFNGIERTWTQMFSAPDGDPSAVYPKGIAFPGPVPRMSKGQYAVIPFTPTTNQYVNLYWDQVQAKLGETYAVRPADGMFFSISPCKGDLRMWETASADPFLRKGCRNFATSASLQWVTSASTPQSTEVLCKLTAGKKYYLHILPANPTGGLNTGEHSCSAVSASAGGCDVGVRIQSAVVP